MTMTIIQSAVTIGLCVLATVLTRAIPFIVFAEKRETPAFIKYIGKYLPSAVFGMLVVFSFKNVDVLSGSHGIPELLASLVTIGLHLWKRQMLISIAGGTISYMLLINLVFV